MRLVAAVVAAAAVGAATPLEQSGRFLESRRTESGAFAERHGAPSLSLTAWSVLALRAAGSAPAPETRAYLAAQEPETAAEAAVALLAAAAAREETAAHVERLRAFEHPNGAIGATLNSTMWAVLALRQAREPVSPATRRLLLARQTRSGGWGWAAGVAPDSNDTAAAVQALRALAVRGRPITRALAFLGRHRTREGGFELTRGRGADSQSTAWAIQAYLAAGKRPPRAAVAYLARMRRGDGSYRYSARYPNATPVWVTAQVLPAVARKPFPLP